MEVTHTPVLLEETVQYLAPRSGTSLMVDATMGEGGHSFAFLSRFPGLSLIGIDADSSIQAAAKERLREFSGRVEFHSGWAQDFFAGYPMERKRPAAVLADLGVSLFHYERSGRGFSFRLDEKLDMRLDVSCGPSAADLVARLPEKELADLLFGNADERYSRRIAKAIVEERKRAAITTTTALVQVVERAVPDSYRHGRLHPATKTFQALRIAVNGELSRLTTLLEGALKVLEPGGRLGVISFHSMEDRLVKSYFKIKNRNCTCAPEAPKCTCGGRRVVNILTKKGIAPGADEIKRNPPSRSARLRVVEKIVEEKIVEEKIVETKIVETKSIKKKVVEKENVEGNGH